MITKSHDTYNTKITFLVSSPTHFLIFLNGNFIKLLLPKNNSSTNTLFKVIICNFATPYPTYLTKENRIIIFISMLNSKIVHIQYESI